MTIKVVIVGGGAIGSAIAYFLSAHPGFSGEVTVIERDPSYRTASSALSASSIRQQFLTPLNVRLSQYGLDFIRRAPDLLAIDGERPALAFHEAGYLVLASEAGAGTLRTLHTFQRGLGAPVGLLEPHEIGKRFPWMCTAGVALGSLGLAGEGWFDGYGLLQAFRKAARARGVTYLADEATGFATEGNSLRMVELQSGARVACDLLVNAAGPWAGHLARRLGIELPVRARRRNVFVFTCREKLPHCPLVVDPSGLWFRPEGDRFIAGISPKDGESDPDDLPLEVDHAAFEETLWPILAHRVPAFEAIRPAGAWAGYYEVNSFDQNGIVGPHPDFANLLLAAGFSGHGLQHAPGIGRGVAEWIVDGGYRTLDLSPLAFDRIPEGRPLLETNVF